MRKEKTATNQRSTAVGVFNSHEDASRAVDELKRAGFRADQISLVGKNEKGEVESGRFLVTVQAANRYDKAWAIMHRLGAYNHETAAASTSRTATARATGNVAATRGTGDERTMKLHEEQLNVSKQQQEAGQVRVRKDVVTEHKTVDVPVSREEVVIERHPASGKASSSDIRQ